MAYTGATMRQSQLFTRTRREAPADEVAKNAQLLIRAGYIHKEMAGVYSYLPLGLRVLERIIGIIREEMNAVGGQEMLMTALQDKALWSATDRWDDAKVSNWFKTALAAGGETGLGITHEEPITRIMSEHVSSYRDLPVYAYQFQTKFRNELRAKSGLMRGREFMMKDLYSFSRTDEEHESFYAKMREAYLKIFERAGLGDRVYVTYASGGIFSEFSEEFQVVSEAGEDTVYIDEKSRRAVNKEVYTDEALEALGLAKDALSEAKAIEVGNTFNLGTRFSKALGLSYADESGEKQPVVMGSYGLGPMRLMGTLAEVFADEKGLVWPSAVAPFSVHLVRLVPDEVAMAYADALYTDLTDAGVDVLYDDRDLRAGEKLADSDLLGIPVRLLVGKETIESGQVEVVERKSGEVKRVAREELVRRLSGQE